MVSLKGRLLPILEFRRETSRSGWLAGKEAWRGREGEMAGVVCELDGTEELS